MEQNRAHTGGVSPDRSLMRVAQHALPEGSLITYISSREAQAAFAQGGETGYLEFIAQHQGLRHVLTDNAAQTAFAEGGERAYQEHVRRERARLFPQQAVPFVVTPAKPRKEAPKRPQPPPASKPAEQIPARAVSPRPELIEAQIALQQASDTYAQLVARDRASHLAAFLGGNRFRRIARQVLNPIAFSQAQHEHGQTEAARTAYESRLQEYAAARGGSRTDMITAKLDAMAAFERRVLQLQVRRTYSGLDEQNNPRRNWQDRARLAVTRAWLANKRPVKILMVALPAAAIGAAAGIATIAWSMPGMAVAGIGIAAAYAGRSVGGGITRTVNTYRAGLPAERTLAANRAEMRRIMFASRYPLATTAALPDGIRVSEAYETGTQQVAAENARRVGLAQLVGAVAAGASFAAVRLAGQGVQALTENVRFTNRPVTHPAAAHEPLAPPATPPINPNQFPWDVAHQLRPGNEFDLIRQTIATSNAQFGTQLHLVPQPNGTIWVENGSRALTVAQQARFNIFMLQQFGP